MIVPPPIIQVSWQFARDRSIREDEENTGTKVMARSDRIISPSIQVENGLIIPDVDAG